MKKDSSLAASPLRTHRPAATRPGDMWLSIGGKTYPVETYADASEMVLRALAEYRGHYRDLPSIDILNRRGEKAGYVSTNGKVWLTGGGNRAGSPPVQVWPPRVDLPPLTVTPPPSRLSA